MKTTHIYMHLLFTCMFMCNYKQTQDQRKSKDCNTEANLFTVYQLLVTGLNILFISRIFSCRCNFAYIWECRKSVHMLSDIIFLNADYGYVEPILRNPKQNWFSQLLKSKTKTKTIYGTLANHQIRFSEPDVCYYSE